MTSKINSRGLFLLAVLITSLSCTADLSPDRFIVPDDKVVLEVRLNHRAINLTTSPPFDTVTLKTKVISMSGVEITDSVEVEYVSSTDGLIIYPNGMLRALRQTSAAGDRVFAKVTHNGLTIEDTATVVATTVSGTPPEFSHMNPEIEDHPLGYIHLSSGIGYEDRNMINPNLLPNIVDVNGNTISRYILHYRAIPEGIVDNVLLQRSILEGVRTGTARISISGYIYGKEIADSISVKVADRMVALHRVLPSPQGMLGPRETVISVGGGVYWFNHTDDSLDIVFEDPESASSPCCTLIADSINDSRQGNIPPYKRDTTLPIEVGVWISQHYRMGRDIVNGRSFHRPGRYKYHSRLNPQVWGTIIVNEL